MVEVTEDSGSCGGGDCLKACRPAQFASYLRPIVVDGVLSAEEELFEAAAGLTVRPPKMWCC